MKIGKLLSAGSLLAAISTGVAVPATLTAADNVSHVTPLVSQLGNRDAPNSGTVVGASPAPASGSGPGTLAVWQPGERAARSVVFGTANTTSGNSFYVASDRAIHSIFVPTFAGITYVVSTYSWNVVGQFDSLTAGRVAKVTPNGKLVVIESGTTTAAYQTTAPYSQVFLAPVGGNALVLSPNGKDAFVGGNADTNVAEISMISGKQVATFPVSNSGDMVWARGQVFSANIATGVMSAINPATGKIVSIATPEVDPNFSYSDISAANAGFMQLSVSPGHRWIYAAGFSGHILKFSALRDTYLGEVAVDANTAGANLLSGLVVLKGGKQAVVTVENLNESVVVSLKTGEIVRSASALASNRWINLR